MFPSKVHNHTFLSKPQPFFPSFVFQLIRDVIIRRALKCKSEVDRRVLAEACKILTGEEEEEGSREKDDSQEEEKENSHKAEEARNIFFIHEFNRPK